MGCHFLFQGILLTQGLNPGLLHCRQTLYCLSHSTLEVRTMEYYSAVKKNEIRPFAATWMGLEITILMKSEKENYGMISLVCRAFQVTLVVKNPLAK